MTKIVLSMYTSKTFYILRDCKACRVRSLGEIVKLAERALLERLWSLRSAPSWRNCEACGSRPLGEIVKFEERTLWKILRNFPEAQGDIVKLVERALGERLWSLQSSPFGRDCEAWGACSKGEIVKLAERALWERLWSLQSSPFGRNCEACGACSRGEIVKLAELSLWLVELSLLEKL